MKRLFGYSLILSCLIILSSSCSRRLVDFTIISTKNIDLSKAGTFQRAKMRMEGKDVAHTILIFPTGMPNMKEAIDRALEKIPGAIALVDGVVYSKSFWAIIYGQSSYVIEGTPLIDPALSEKQNTSIPDGEFLVFNFDKKGNLKDCKSVTEPEYLALKSQLINYKTEQKYIVNE